MPNRTNVIKPWHCISWLHLSRTSLANYIHISRSSRRHMRAWCHTVLITGHPLSHIYIYDCYRSTESGGCVGSEVMCRCYLAYKAGRMRGQVSGLGFTVLLSTKLWRWGPGSDAHLEPRERKQADLKFRLRLIVNPCPSPDSSSESVSNSITHPQELWDPLQSPKKRRCRGSIFSAREMSEQPHELLEKDHRACAQGLEEWEVLDPKNKDFQLLALWNCLWVKWIFFFNCCLWKTSGHSDTRWIHKYKYMSPKHMHTCTHVHAWIYACTNTCIGTHICTH